MKSLMTALFDDGYHTGPLFIPRHRRAPIRIDGKEGELHRRQTRRATPAWADLSEIKNFYAEAKRLTKETGELHVVDHIVPKMGKIVCGLHVPWNLRVIHWLPNAQKGNGSWPGMPFEQIELF